MSQHRWETLSYFRPPVHEDVLTLPDGDWTLLSEMPPRGWTLFRNGERHPQIANIDGMQALLTVIERVAQAQA